ncbi:MAG: ABC transporter ATP-binding protein [Sediminibacterium sp.]|jgi:ABC-2 type transport system ATP-binding protein|nr:ABC transporter ATP-binding protein [Sediminibacterium sp.]
MSLVVSNIQKQYNGQKAVDNISFELHPGEIVGFLGPNGAGKSTTLKMIAGVLIPDAGKITINNQLVQMDSIASKKLIGYLPESNPLYKDLYVKEYLQFLGTIHQVNQLSNRIKEVIDFLQLGLMQHKKIGELSKGYQQRLGIAAAIIHQPALLLLDEPTSGLDPNQLIEIREVIKQLSKHSMILFSSHILQEVTAVCSRVLVMHQGRLVANEPMEELLKPKTNHLHILFEEELTHMSAHIATLSLDIVSIDKHLLVVKTAEGKDVKKIVMQFALDMGLNIERLHTEEASLEEIFKLLTH